MSDLPKDIIVSSRKIKELFLERCATLEIPVEAVCAHVGIKVSDFELWQNAIDPDDALLAMPQEKVLLLMESVFVNVQIVLVTKPTDNLSETQRFSLDTMIHNYSVGHRPLTPTITRL